MNPVLYLDNRSPPCRSVLLLIEELGIEVEKQYIDLEKQENLQENYLKVSPMHSVPALKDANVCLTDSHAILIYLCEHYGNNTKLWPSYSIRRINVLNKLFYSGALLFRRDSDVIGGIIGYHWNEEQIQPHIARIKEQYDILEIFLTLNKFVACDRLTIADLSIVTIVSTMDIIVRVNAEQWPKLHNWWYNVMQKLPYYEKANRDGLNRLKIWVEKSSDFKINK